MPEDGLDELQDGSRAEGVAGPSHGSGGQVELVGEGRSELVGQIGWRCAAIHGLEGGVEELELPQADAELAVASCKGLGGRGMR